MKKKKKLVGIEGRDLEEGARKERAVEVAASCY